ncbi:MAG: hypothetical protein ABSF55_02860 [Candidatus Staskawiczbacteria bacterium]
MILLVHLLLGALIGKEINNPILAIILAFLSHYLLDFLPHTEYDIENITKRQWRKAVSQIIKALLDFCSGIMLIFLFSNPALPAGRQAIIYVCAFFAILPDGLSFLSSFSKNKILQKHLELHHEKIHFLRNKKISKFWRVFSQVAVAVICIYFLKF